MAENTDNKIKKEVFDKLWGLSGSLKGVGALLEQQSNNPCYNHDELFGLGQFLKNTAEEISKIEDILRCDYKFDLDDNPKK